MRVPNGKPDKAGGYIYRDDAQRPGLPEKPPEQRIAYESWKRQLADFQSQQTVADVQRFAESLGVSAISLMLLGIGRRKVNGFHQWTFPMQDAEGRVIGIRTRDRKGKRCIKGSKLGLFTGPHPDHSNWLVVEGESDAAAAITLGIRGVIGVPGAGQAARHLVELARKHRPRMVILFADNDDAGRRGMEQLAGQLHCKTQFRSPVGANDLRAWVKAGCTRKDVAG